MLQSMGRSNIVATPSEQLLRSKSVRIARNVTQHRPKRGSHPGPCGVSTVTVCSNFSSSKDSCKDAISDGDKRSSDVAVSQLIMGCIHGMEQLKNSIDEMTKV
jgi:hypothetical protein